MNTRSLSTAVLVVPLSLLLPSCVVEVPGDGQAAHETRKVAPFTEVDAESSLDVEIRQGRDFSVELLVDKNLVRHVTTRVEDGRLIIDADEPISPRVGGAQVIVTMPEISRAVLGGSGVLTIPSWDTHEPITLVLAGSGDLSFDGAAPELTANLDGTGDATLRGRAGSIDLTLSGTGDLDGKALAASRATLSLSGSGDLSAQVDGPVDVSLSGSGDVDLFGQPRIGKESKSGSGDVILHR
jgi:hypothetical protein